MNEYKFIKDQDTEVYEAIMGEEAREESGIELIRPFAVKWTGSGFERIFQGLEILLEQTLDAGEE